MRPSDVCHFPTMLYFLFKVFLLLLLILIYCEFLIYYFVLLACSWPQLSKLDQDFTVQPPADAGQKPLRIMLIADAHLLGSRKTHWFDRWRNEWQLYRSFQSAQFIFEPDLIFFVGDITADGEFCSDREWNATVQRFQSIFSVSSGQNSYVLAGNHDIGWHYSVSEARLRRFEQSFHAPHVRLVTIESHQAHFVLINSMAFEGDHCRLCERAERELNDVVEQLNRTGAWTKPILLTHFPLYRPSDANCSQSSPSLSLSQPRTPFRPNKEGEDVLSQDASEQLLAAIKPRLVFAGHTHTRCYMEHHNRHGKAVPEWTIPSFSWRIRDNPSFALLSLTTNNERVTLCSLPRETTILWFYGIGAFFVLFYLLFGERRSFFVVVLWFLRKIIRI